MKKNEYTKLEMEIVKFANEDIVITSSPEENRAALDKDYAPQLDKYEG